MICDLVIEPCWGSDNTLAFRVYDEKDIISLYTNNLRMVDTGGLPIYPRNHRTRYCTK